MYFFYFDECGNAKMNVRSLNVYPWFALGAVGFHDSQWKKLDQSITMLKRQTLPGVNPADLDQVYLCPVLGNNPGEVALDARDGYQAAPEAIR